MLGIGGGELLGPLLLHFTPMPPVQSSATTATTSMMSSASNFFNYMLKGYLNPQYNIMVFFVGIIAGTIGRRVSLYYAAKSGRNSIFVIALGIVLLISLGLDLDHLIEEPQNWNWEDIC